MYYGVMTEELEELYDQYYEKFGVEPCSHEEFEYGGNDLESYTKYVNDIKEALRKNKDLVELAIERYGSDYVYDDCIYIDEDE